ncbi:PHD finger protein ING2 [Carex littledalei]|uniref:PHD finger protein ING n=1 Tax=Carex littledalei TaxID=544730 RepID=A0A833QPV9_9POAL|nr:PHD finger protein ING2 [Carex littledalei]
MAIARTGVYIDDYLEYSSTLSGDLQRILFTMRELDERAQGIIGQTKDQTKYYVAKSSHSLNHEFEDESALDKLKKEIEASQENALGLCTEKVLLARQAYDLIESHVKRLTEDLEQFADDLKQEGKLPPDEPAVLPPLPVVSREERRKGGNGGYITPQSSKRLKHEREWDVDLMPPPGSNKKNSTATYVEPDQPIDPNEPTYCICHQVSYGDMIACDNENCEGGEWFHYSCVGLTPETRFKGKWYCPTCRDRND